MATIIDFPRKESDAVLDAMIQHWVKARVDNPLQIAARLDEAAKYILAVAGILQGILVAVIKLESKQTAYPDLAIGAMSALVVTAFFATMTLLIQSGYLGTAPIYNSLRKASDVEFFESFDSRINEWCSSNDRVRFWKRLLLALAMLSLVASMSFSLVCVWTTIHPG